MRLPDRRHQVVDIAHPILQQVCTAVGASSNGRPVGRERDWHSTTTRTSGRLSSRAPADALIGDCRGMRMSVTTTSGEDPRPPRPTTPAGLDSAQQIDVVGSREQPDQPLAEQHVVLGQHHAYRHDRRKPRATPMPPDRGATPPLGGVGTRVSGAARALRCCSREVPRVQGRGATETGGDGCGSGAVAIVAAPASGGRWVVLAVLVAIGAGAGMACLAGARRTARRSTGTPTPAGSLTSTAVTVATGGGRG